MDSGLFVTCAYLPQPAFPPGTDFRRSREKVTSRVPGPWCVSPGLKMKAPRVWIRGGRFLADTQPLLAIGVHGHSQRHFPVGRVRWV
jgi:hypothetical protein